MAPCDIATDLVPGKTSVTDVRRIPVRLSSHTLERMRSSNPYLRVWGVKKVQRISLGPGTGKVQRLRTGYGGPLAQAMASIGELEPVRYTVQPGCTRGARYIG